MYYIIRRGSIVTLSSFWLLLLFFWCSCQLLVVCDSEDNNSAWITTDFRTTKGTEASTIKLPRQVLTRLGIHQSYSIIFPVMTTPAKVIHVCDVSSISRMTTSEVTSLLFWKNESGRESCERFFCSDNNSEEISDHGNKKKKKTPYTYTLGNETIEYRVNNKEGIRVVSIMFNFCRNCVPQFSFQNSMEEQQSSQCKLYSRLSKIANKKQADQCRSNNNNDEQKSRAIMHSNYPEVEQQDEELFICSCDLNDPQSLSYKCGDAYQKFFIPFIYVGVPAIFLILHIALAIYQLVYLNIPNVVQSISIWRGEASELATSMTFKERIKAILSLRSQAIYLLFISTIFAAWEQILSLTLPTVGWDSLAICRTIASALIPLSYSLVLIQWTRTCHQAEQQEAFNKSDFAIWVVYLTHTFLLIAFGICLAMNKIEVGYAIMASAMIIFSIVFPCGFTVYGYRILRIIRESKVTDRRSTLRYRFTRFMILVNLCFLIILAVAILLVLSYVFGWDYMGLFFGLYRPFWIDICMFSSQLLVALMMVGKRGLIAAYGIRLGGLLACVRVKTMEERSLIVQ